MGIQTEEHILLRFTLTERFRVQFNNSLDFTSMHSLMNCMDNIYEITIFCAKCLEYMAD